ncbi:DNA-binding IclR family transcriptional regulator [Halarchaeum rubridurum]|uniref:DNA-binding IclR family transcriptional regulator n=2 Tax=Halarchaeum rubridurum TaxID=489911 RepID=A0A8T4GN74_9EURY|nr:IclR family transcriptional regulator [Halarchaeum rubridurum]MBP1954788.1 DNA-binding IclR family transcriptional regulator [Halarchaeum rubridurum]
MTTPTMQSVERVFEVVDVLWREDGAGPAAVAEALDIHRSTAHGYLRSLEAVGYAVNDGGTYELSYRFLDMGTRLQYRNRVFQAAREEISRLSRETGELPTLAVEEAGGAVILHQRPGENALELGTYSGMRTPLHTTASGKTILAHMPAERVDAVLDGGLERVTDRTVTDPERLRERLASIREDGHAVDVDQQVVGMGTVAVPLHPDDDHVASLAIACPSERIRNESYQDELVGALKESRNRISIKYQYGR